MKGCENNMIDKRVELADGIKEIRDGDSIVIGGWGPFRKPMALIREIVRSPVNDLTILSFAGMDLDLLIGAGKVKTAIFGFVSFEGAPGRPGNFNRARMEGSVSMKELSEYMFICQFRAAAERLPFYPVRGGIGTDILTLNSEIKTFQDPYSSETLVAIPACAPDYALIHVNEADQLGNAKITGEPYLDRLFVRAGQNVIISAEKIVPVGEIQDNTILSCWVDKVVEAPQGALPCDCYPEYQYDAKAFVQYGQAAKDPTEFDKYLEKIIQKG